MYGQGNTCNREILVYKIWFTDAYKPGNIDAYGKRKYTRMNILPSIHTYDSEIYAFEYRSTNTYG